MMGCINSWVTAKTESYQDEQRRLEEQKRQEEEERQRREEERKRQEEERKRREEERKRRKEEERQRREEEERRRQEEERNKREEEEKIRKEEELRLKEEEEMLLKEEEERMKREEEERKQKEEEERNRLEEEARQKQNEEERMLKEEEQRMKDEEERQRKADEERKKREDEERKRKEEEERRKRQEAARKKREEEIRRKEEEKRLKEEEKMRRKEEEERKKMEENERKRREDRERKIRLEEARQRREEEKKRKEEEQKLKQEEQERMEREEKERRRREEAERRKRQKEARERQEEERRRNEEERRLKEEEERKLKEEEQRKKREERDRKLREEEERRKREEEARKKGEEEEKRRKEEEERQKEEEERRRKEEEERQKKEEEERKRREEEQRRKLDEEARKKREEDERKRLLEEEIKKRKAAEERRKVEDEERRRREEWKRRFNPQNWPSFIYKRPDSDDDNGFHNGMCCSVSALEDSLTEDELECIASDEYRDVLPCVDIGEKLAGSLVTVKSKTGEKALEAPMRVFVPHCNVSDVHDELILKTSVDGSDWEECTPIASNISSRQCKISGVEVNKFSSLKVISVAKTKSQELTVDNHGINQSSTTDKNIKVTMPRGTFVEPTQVKIQARPVKDESLQLATRHHMNCDNVLSASSVVSITCQNATNKDIEIETSRHDIRSGKSKYYHMYRDKGDNWKFADTKLKGRNMAACVTLPAGHNKYSVVELETRQDTGREDVLKAAEEIYNHAHESVARVLVRQKRDTPGIAVIHCIPRHVVPSRLTQLENLGYTVGPDTSREFCILDGQYIEFDCKGNIAMTTGSTEKIKLPFHAYMDSCKQEVTLKVVDPYRQKDLDSYMGQITFEVLRDDRDRTFAKKVSGELPVALPKAFLLRPKTSHSTAPLQLSHNLLALSKFVAWRLTKNETGSWESFIQYLVSSPREKNRLRRQAVAKCDDAEEWCICDAILKDWMKSKPIYEDKIEPILQALQKCGRQDILDECLRFETIHDDVLGSKKLSQIAGLVDSEWEKLAKSLGVSSEMVEEIKKQNLTTEDQAYTMLCKWKISDDAIQRGVHVLQFLLDCVKTVSGNSDLVKCIEQYTKA